MIKLSEIENIREDLEALKDDEVLYAGDDEAEYVFMRKELYDLFSGRLSVKPAVDMKVIGDDFHLSYEEYENVKRQLDELLEKTFKPKPENLN